MKKINKKLLEKIIITAAPIFTLIMYLLPWMCIYKEKSIWTNLSYESDPLYRNYFDVLFTEGNVFAKVIMWLSLVTLIVVMTVYVGSYVFKDKEKQLMKIGSITLVASTGILVITAFAKLFPTITSMGGQFCSWIDFMTLPYGLLLTYNVASLIYFIKRIDKN